jgi:hypothetical protein
MESEKPESSSKNINNKITFADIIKDQEKEKENIQNQPQILEHFNYYKNIIFTLNKRNLKDKNIKYVSHYSINKTIIYPNSDPKIVKILFQHGLIQSIYPSTEMKEISLLPEPLKRAVKTYFRIITQHQVFIRCYSTVIQVSPERIYQPINVIRLGTTKIILPYESEIKEEILEDEEFIRSISRIRAQDFHIIFQEMNRIITSSDETAWVYFMSPTTLIYSSGRTPRNYNMFNQFYDKIKQNKMENAENTKKRICNILSEYQVHKCNYCGENKSERRILTKDASGR